MDHEPETELCEWCGERINSDDARSIKADNGLGEMIWYRVCRKCFDEGDKEDV